MNSRRLVNNALSMTRLLTKISETWESLPSRKARTHIRVPDCQACQITADCDAGIQRRQQSPPTPDACRTVLLSGSIHFDACSKWRFRRGLPAVFDKGQIQYRAISGCAQTQKVNSVASDRRVSDFRQPITVSRPAASGRAIIIRRRLFKSRSLQHRRSPSPVAPRPSRDCTCSLIVTNPCLAVKRTRRVRDRYLP